MAVGPEVIVVIRRIYHLVSVLHLKHSNFVLLK